MKSSDQSTEDLIKEVRADYDDPSDLDEEEGQRGIELMFLMVDRLEQLEAEKKRIREVEQTNYELFGKTLREKAELETIEGLYDDLMEDNKDVHTKLLATECANEQLKEKLRPLAGIDDVAGFINNVKDCIKENRKQGYVKTITLEKLEVALFPKESEK